MVNKISESGMTPVSTPHEGCLEQRTPFEIRKLCEIPQNLRHLIGITPENSGSPSAGRVRRSG